MQNFENEVSDFDAPPSPHLSPCGPILHNYGEEKGLGESGRALFG